VVDGLQSLGHDAVIGGDNQNHDVGHFCSPGPHGRESLMAGRIDEYNFTRISFDGIGADMLSDTASLPGNHIGLPDII